MTDQAEQERVVGEMVRLVVEVSEALGSRSMLMNQSEHRRAIAVYIYARLSCRAHVGDAMLAPGTLADALSDVLYTYLYRVLHEQEPRADLVRRIAKETVALADSRSGPNTGLSMIESALGTSGYTEDYNELSIANAGLQYNVSQLNVLIDEMLNTVEHMTNDISMDTVRKWRARRNVATATPGKQ